MLGEANCLLPLAACLRGVRVGVVVEGAEVTVFVQSLAFSLDYCVSVDYNHKNSSMYGQ